MRSTSAACVEIVFRDSTVCANEMPMLLPRLRNRLKMAVPCERIAGLRVANVAALSGTKTSPKPTPWMTPGQMMSLCDRSSE